MTARKYLATIRTCAFVIAACTSLATLCVSNAEAAFSPRPATPRVVPIQKGSGTPEQEAMLAKRPDMNIYKTLAYDPELYERWSPLGQYLLNGSTLPPREREMIMLRMGWLCQAEYEWAAHSRIAKGEPGLTGADIHRIAEGPQSKGWSDFERTLLTMVDELRYDTMISDKTWKALRVKYSEQQIMEAMYTASQYQLVSMALNSLGVQVDPDNEERLPKDVPLPKTASAPRTARLTAPRVPPLEVATLTPAQREMAAAQMRDGKLPNLYATMLNFPRLYQPRVRFGSYLQHDSHLPAKTRELVIMRTGHLIKADYEWLHHTPTSKQAGWTDADIARMGAAGSAGWNSEYAAVVNAVDELRAQAFITDATWKELQQYYDVKQLIEIIYTSGGYTMTGVALNSLGVQVEK